MQVISVLCIVNWFCVVLPDNNIASLMDPNLNFVYVGQSFHWKMVKRLNRITLDKIQLLGYYIMRDLYAESILNKE